MHHFLTTGFLTFLGFVLDLVQTSLGTSTHSSVGSSLGTSLVTCLQVLWGSREQFSLGASWTIVWVLSKHSSSPSLNPHPDGAQISLGSLVHPVIGVNFLTGFFSTLHTSLGHLEHLVLVVEPEVSSSHFSSTSVLHSTTSSSTSWTSCLVQHSDSYSVLQISGPWTSQSFTRGVRQTSAVSLKAICSYSMKQLFLKFSSQSSSCWDSYWVT